MREERRGGKVWAGSGSVLCCVGGNWYGLCVRPFFPENLASPMKPLTLIIAGPLVLLFLLTDSSTAGAQTGLTNGSAIARSQAPSLEDYLISNLRATTHGQRSYVREIVKLVDQNKLEKRIVLALERYARRKSPYFPLPVYERAMRVEGARRGIAVPTIQEIVARNGAATARAVQDTRIR